MTAPEWARKLALQTDLETILTSRHGFGLTTATPLQRAVCRIVTGVPLGELAHHPDVLEAVGDVTMLWDGQPDEFYFLAPARTGKSTVVAALAIRATQTVDLDVVGGDKLPPRYSILSLDVDKAKAVYGHVRGALLGPFSHLSVKDPTNFEALVRHPSGRVVEIKVVAGKANGAAVVSRWSIGCSFDEAPRMDGATEKVVNLPDTLTGVRERLLPGAQVAMVGSKWAPWGPVYDACQEHGGRPSEAKSVVVIGHNGGEAHKLNPRYWTPGRRKRLRVKDVDKAKVAIDNQWASPSENMFAKSEIEAATRPLCETLPPHPCQHYVAIIDPATRGNAWSMVLLTRTAFGLQVAMATEWQGSKDDPLDVDEVFRKTADLLKPYRCNRLVQDQWAADSNRAVAYYHGLILTSEAWTSKEQWDAFKELLAQVKAKAIELAPVAQLAQDLQRVVKKPNTKGGMAIHLPVTSDGRHCDYAAALALGMLQTLQRPDTVSAEIPAGWTQEELDDVAEAEREQQRSEDDDTYDEMEYDDEP